ncbi:MAG: hypothetical protein ACOY90_23030 [Candidatus Zhuqueibacterota bacterium]
MAFRVICLGCLLMMLGFCDNSRDAKTTAGSPATSLPEPGVILEFSVVVDRDVYEYTNYGEPPQMAFWLERPETGDIRTVWVSHRTGRRQWKGKVECPVALPFWESRHALEKSNFRERHLLQRLLDAITGATPQGGVFSVKTTAPENSHWDYFIEVNLSGDFNAAFPSQRDNGEPDHEGNGQPSLIFKGRMEATPGVSHAPELIGRTDQWVAIDSIITDMAGITSARKILRNIQVNCISPTANE